MSGLVGHWPLHEDSGDAADLSGNGNDGTVNGATQGVWGRGGLTAYSFDGTDDVDTSLSSLSTPVTVSLWLRLSSTSVAGEAFGNFASTSSDLYVGYDNNNDRLRVSPEGPGLVIEQSPDTDQWVHLTAVLTEDVYAGFLNGEISDTTAGAAVTFDSGTSYKIGQRGDDDLYWNGSIADVRVYNRALSPQEIETLYDWGSTDYSKPSLTDGTDSGSVSRWTFNEDTQTTVATDSWGDNDGNINGAVYTSDGIEDQALSFDGTDDYVTTSNYIDVGTSGVTVSAWVFADSWVDGNRIANNVDFSTDEGYGLFVTANNDIRMSIADGTVRDRVDFSAPPLSAWNHITGVYDGSEIKGYTNGTLVNTASSTLSIASHTSGMDIGGDAAGNTLSGSLDDVRIYDRALSDWEVFELYRWGAKGRDMRERTVIE